MFKISLLGGIYIKKFVLLNKLINLSHNKLTIFLLLFIMAFCLGIGGVSAATDNNSTAINTQNSSDYNTMDIVSSNTGGGSNAIVLENFSDVSKWNTLNNASISKNVIGGDEGIKVTSPPDTYPSISKGVSYNFKGIAPEIQLWFYLENDPCSDINIILYGTNMYFYTSIHQDITHKGLNSLAFPQSSWTSYNGMTWNDAINTIELITFNQPNCTTNVTFLTLEYNVTGTPSIVITFDDGSESVYTNAFPIMQQYGIKGTCYINPAYIGQTWYMTLAELQELHNAGWTIASHAYEHVDLTTLSSEQKLTEIQTAITWLNNNGFGDGAYYFASPYGKYDDEVLAILRQLGVKTHRTITEGTITNPADDLLQLPDKIIGGNFTLAQAKAIVDEAIETKTTIFILLHEITPTNSSDTQWTITNFSDLMAYINQTGVITLTNDQWYYSTRTIVNNRTGILYNTLQSAIDDINTLNGDTVIVSLTNLVENVNLGKKLFIISDKNTTINASNPNNPVFTINAAGAGSKIQGFNIIGGANGIKLQYAPNCTFTLNNITGNGFAGIYLDSSDNNTLSNNQISNNPYGIFSEYGDNNVIINNQVNNNPYAGIVLRYWSDGNQVNGNTIKNNGYGLHLLYSSNNAIKDNTVSNNNFYGMYLDNSQNNNADNNTIAGNPYSGVALYFGSNNNTFGVNNVTGNGFGFYLYGSNLNKIGLNISKAADISNNLFYGIYMDSSTGNTIGNANIKNNPYAGIALYFNSNSNTISQNNITGNGFGTYMYGSSSNQFTENNLSNNNFYGVYMDSSPNNKFSRNQINNNPYSGVAMYFESNNNTFTANNLTANGFGFYISSSNNNTINAGTGSGSGQNTIQDNMFYGFYMENADGNVIEGNTLARNAYAGLSINSGSDNNAIRQNSLNNNGFGVYIDSSNNNNIYSNSFVDNKSQALDNGTNNWDNGTSGNHWSDWAAGVPRPISGGSNIDHHPY